MEYESEKKSSATAKAGLALGIVGTSLAVLDWIWDSNKGWRGRRHDGGYEHGGHGPYPYGYPHCAPICGPCPAPVGNQTVVVHQDQDDDEHRGRRRGRGYDREYEGEGERGHFKRCEFVTEKEAHLAREIAEKGSVIAKLEAEKYTDNKTERLAEKVFSKIDKVEECLERKICKVEEEAERRSDFLNEKFTKGYEHLAAKYGELSGDLKKEVAERKCCCEKEEMARVWGDKLEAERRECCCKELHSSVALEAERRDCGDDKIMGYIKCNCAPVKKVISPHDICPPVKLCCDGCEDRERGGGKGEESGRLAKLAADLKLLGLQLTPIPAP